MLRQNFLRLFLNQNLNLRTYCQPKLETFSVFKKLLHATSYLEKKKGQFTVIDPQNNLSNQENDDEKSKYPKVKLYPGFQESTEEIINKFNLKNTDNDVLGNFFTEFILSLLLKIDKYF